VLQAVRAVNPEAAIVRGHSVVTLEDPERVRGRRVLVIEDGPTLTHGGMAYGAGTVAAQQAHAAELVDPRPFAAPAIARVFEQYPHIGAVLPAVGYSAQQLQALADTINASDAEVVVSATPADLAALIRISKPVVRARYEYDDPGRPGLREHIESFLKARRLTD